MPSIQILIGLSLLALVGTRGTALAEANHAKPLPTLPVTAKVPSIDPPRGAVCTIRGNGRPFDDICSATSVALTADADAKEPIAKIDPGSVNVTFQLFQDSAMAWATIESGGVRASGYWPLVGETFRLRKEATALGGHAHLLVDSPVEIRLVSSDGIAVRVHDPAIDLEKLDARATCNAIAFDSYMPKDEATPRASKGEHAVSVANHLELRVAPERDVAFVVEPNVGSELTLDMQVYARRRDDVLVGFKTDHARFEGWVKAAEIQRTDGDFGLLGLGAEARCGKGRLGFSQDLVVRLDTDAIVAKYPADGGGFTSVRFEKGAHVYPADAAFGWVVVRPVESAIAPPDGLSFWVPEEALIGWPPPRRAVSIKRSSR